MGCCGSLNSSSTGLPPINAVPPEARGQRYLQPGENVECWANRTQSTQDKSGGTPPEGKIITAAIAPNCDLTIDQMIEAYPPEGATISSWDPIEWSPTPVSTITETQNIHVLNLHGTFSDEDENKTFELKVTVNFSDGESDTKSYTIKPIKCNVDEDALILTHPFPGSRITAPFNEIRPASGGGTRAHKGLDFGNGGGTGPCVAAADGKVLAVNSSNMAGGSGFTGYGYWVQIQHSDKKGTPLCNTFYAHLASINVSAGQTVSKGQKIGMVGGTGPHGANSYTPHLHFELHIGGKCKDPKPYIDPPSPIKAGVNNARVGTGEPAAPGGSGNYGASPQPGTSRVNPDGSYESTPNNKPAAISQGTVDVTNIECKEEPPLDPATPEQTAEQPCVEMVTIEQLKQIMPNCGNRANVYIGHINRVIKEDVIYDLADKCGDEAKQRISMFLAQIAHESGELRHSEEIWGPTEAQRRYEGRGDLGNTQSGDGTKFKGRGLIQLTGRKNYEAFGNYVGQDLTSNPSIVATDPYLATKSAGWFWKTNKLNSKSGSISASTKTINGGTNGIADRERKWSAAKSALSA